MTADPSGIGACIRTVGVIVAYPNRSNFRSFTMEARRRPTVWTSPGAVNPGAGWVGAEDPADLLGALQDQDLLPGLCEVGGRDEPVVAAADQDDVELLLRHQAALRPFFFSLRYSSAAIRPGAPMIPPPGWVADPHIQSLSTGVR